MDLLWRIQRRAQRESEQIESGPLVGGVVYTAAEPLDGADGQAASGDDHHPPADLQGSKLMVGVDAGLLMEEPRNPPRCDECEVRASGEQEMMWEGADVGKLAGKAVRIRFEMHSAALYSIQFV